MNGRAILILVAGMIIITTTIMYNIEANSTKIVGNFHDYFMRQTTQNVAQSGVNLAMNQLLIDRNWRAGFQNAALGDGRATVNLWNTSWDGIPVIAIRSIGETDYTATLKRRDTTIAYAFLTDPVFPVNIIGLLTLQAPSKVNGNMEVDGRDWNLDGTISPGTGIPGVWTTASEFGTSGSYSIGGTVGGIDYIPTSPHNPECVMLNQVHPSGYPKTPDQVFGGSGVYFPDGTLKAMAQSGYAGSQYVTDPAKLKMPLSGVTYVEVKSGVTVQPPKVTGDGILIFHAADRTSRMKGLEGLFKGIIIADQVEHLHGTFYGGIIGLADTQPDAILGNGNAILRFSREAILKAQAYMKKEGKPSIIAWWE